MSRKPVVVSLDKEEEPKKPAPKAAAKKTTSKQTKPVTRKPAAQAASSRKPLAVEAPQASEAIDVFDPDSEAYIEQLPTSRLVTTKRSKWGLLFFGCVTVLVSLGIGLWFTSIIETLFTRHEWLGWGASVLLILAGISLAVIILRELRALWRLRKLAKIREDVMRVMEDETQANSKILDKIVGIYENREEMEWHISRLASHGDDVMDDRDRLLLAEQTLMKPLDDEAKQIIATSAKRISVVTAVNPAASLDVIFTGYQILRMLRQLTALYGNRPGSLGTLKLAGMVGSHLALTGGLALSDTLLQQFLGKGIAGRLSAKLGEGTVNGILTSRIGIAAIDLCRPMPFTALEKPGLKEFVSLIVGSISGKTNSDQDVS